MEVFYFLWFILSISFATRSTRTWLVETESNQKVPAIGKGKVELKDIEAGQDYADSEEEWDDSDSEEESDDSDSEEESDIADSEEESDSADSEEESKEKEGAKKLERKETKHDAKFKSKAEYKKGSKNETTHADYNLNADQWVEFLG